MKIEKKDTGINFISLAEKNKIIDFESSIFFDIETTGFSAKNTKPTVSSLSCSWAAVMQL